MWHLWGISILPLYLPVNPRYLVCLSFMKLILATQYLGKYGSLKTGWFSPFPSFFLRCQEVLRCHSLEVVLEVPLKAQILAQGRFGRDALHFQSICGILIHIWKRGGGECLCKIPSQFFLNKEHFLIWPKNPFFGSSASVSSQSCPHSLVLKLVTIRLVYSFSVICLSQFLFYFCFEKLLNL